MLGKIENQTFQMGTSVRKSKAGNIPKGRICILQFKDPFWLQKTSFWWTGTLKIIILEKRQIRTCGSTNGARPGVFQIPSPRFTFFCKNKSCRHGVKKEYPSGCKKCSKNAQKRFKSLYNQKRKLDFFFARIQLRVWQFQASGSRGTVYLKNNKYSFWTRRRLWLKTIIFSTVPIKGRRQGQNPNNSCFLLW